MSTSSPISWLTPPSRALIVGVNKYASRSILNLRGCVGDARDVARFFVKQVGMEPQHIRMLTSPDDNDERKPNELLATRANILEGIISFLGEAPANSEVLFYFSGHGAKVPLAPAIQFGQEQGSGLVPADARVKGVPELLNRELYYLMAQLAKRQLRLTMIADACNAGRAARDKPPPPSIPFARLTASGHLRDENSLLTEYGGIDLQTIETLYQTQVLPFAFIAGALPTQSSYEVLRADGKIRGRMTTALLQILTTAHGQLSYRELGRAIRASLLADGINNTQYPNVSGDTERGIFSTTQIVRPYLTFVVLPKTENHIRQYGNGDDTIAVDGGSIAGLDVGSQLTSFADWALKKPQSQWVVELLSHEPTKKRDDAFPRAILKKKWGTTPSPGTPLLLHQIANRPKIYFAPDAKAVAHNWRDKRGETHNQISAKFKSPYLMEVFTVSQADYIVHGHQNKWLVRARQEPKKVLARHPQGRNENESLGSLLDRMISYQRFIGITPQQGKSASKWLTNQISLTAEFTTKRGKKQPLTPALESQPLPDIFSNIRITLHNHGKRTLYAYLYRLMPTLYLAQCIWPQRGDEASLQIGEARSTTWSYRAKSWRKGHLLLKLYLSTVPLNELPEWPCGDEQVLKLRGGKMANVRSLKPERTSWGIEYYRLGQM